jgi:hypothetical protein
MNNLKNLLIAVLTGLLALSLFTQPAQSAAISKEAKAIEYAHCLALYRQERVAMLDTYQSAVANHISYCVKYRP